MTNETKKPIVQRIGDNVMESIMNTIAEQISGTIESHIESSSITLEELAEVIDIFEDDSQIPLNKINGALTASIEKFRDELSDNIWEYVTENFIIKNSSTEIKLP